MATLIRPSKNDRYYINPAHLTFVENSGYGVQLIQVSASSSCYISVYDPDNGIRVNEDSGIKKWKVTAYNNKFPDGDTDPWNIYVRLERNGTSALVVYDKKERKVSGAVVTEEGEGAPDESYYYIKIGTVGDTDGVSKIREIVYDTGYLDTYEANNAMGEILASMFIPHYDDPANPNKLTWIEAKSHMGIQGGVAMFVEGDSINLPSIYDGLRVDNQSIYWEEIKDEEGNVIDKVLKAKADDFKGTLGSLTNVGEWADAAATADRIMVQKKDSTTWTSLSLEELGTASFENVKESGEGNAYTSIELSEDKKTLTLNKGESFAKQTDYEALNTKVTDFLEGSDTDGIINKWRELESFLSNMEQSDDLAEILSGKADKGTTLEDYGITDAYTKSEVDSALKDYVTIDGKETITGEKNFTGGLNVNGSPIVYDKDKKYWKLTGDLLVTGGVTMFANEGTYSPSTIMDAITTDNVNLKVVNGVLTFVGETGGGVADSVDWENIDGKPSWIDSVKPSYTFSEIGSKPTTLSGYGITDAKISNGVITLGSSTITPLTQEKGDARYLKLTGGTIEGTLQIKRSASVIKYLDAEGESYGWLGFNAVDTPVMYTSTANRSIKLLHAENYNTYAPKLDGTGAKGVWDIDISGEASKVKCTAGTADTYRPVVVTVPDAATQNLYYGEKVLANYATGDLKVSSTTVDGIRIYKSSTGVLRIDGDVVLSGALTMYGTDSVNTSTIMDGVVVDGTTIMNDGKKLYLNPNLELGGIDEDELNSYLTSNKYLTQTTGDARYVTAIGTSGNYLTYTKNGATQNVTVPYATNADKLDGIHSTGFYKSNAGSLESDELETFVNRDSGGYSVTYRSASTGDVSYSGMFSVLKSGAGSVQAIELIANNYTLKQGALQVRLNVDGTRYSATKTIAFSDGNVATADTASKLSTVSKKAWGQTYWTNGGVPTDISGNMTGVGNITMSGSINSAVTINSGDDSAWIKGSGHNMYFGGTGYANQSYYFRPLYGASGATTSNLYIQNASASSSPTFTTTHSFLSNGNASHAGTLTINGIKLSKSKDDVLFIDANLVVRGAITMYGTNSVAASTIMDGILVDDSTIIKDPTTKKLMLNPDLEIGGGLDETALASYLTTNKYLTQTTGDTRYVTALGIDGNNLTWTKNGVVNNITVPYATTAKELTSYSAITFSKSDNSGKPCYLLIADVTSWYNVSSGATNYGVAGFVYGYRNGASPAYSMNIAARCAYGKGYYSLGSSLKSIIEPRVVSYNSKYYLALYLQGSNRTFNFIGRKDNLLSSFTELQCSDGNGTYSGLSVIYKGSATGTSSKADSLSTSRTISITGHATGSGVFDGSEDLGINVTIPTRNVYINGTGYTVHSTITTDTTGVYAPTSGGTSGYVLKANGATYIPTWVAQSSLSVGTASKLSTVSKTAWGQTYWTSGGVPTSISGDMTGVGNVTPEASNTYSLGSSSSLWNDLWVCNVKYTNSSYLGFTNSYASIRHGGSGSQLIVDSTSVRTNSTTSARVPLGTISVPWAGLYLGGGSMPNVNGINFTDGSTYVSNQICGNSSGGIGIYSSGSIFLRGGCTKGTSNVTSSGTGVAIDASGNVLATGGVTAGAFSFGNGYQKSTSSKGWYRFATSSTANNRGGTYIFFIRRSYTNSNNEAYIISCIVDHGKVHWNLLNGHANTRLITQVRCTYTNDSTIYFDLYYNGVVSNTVYVNAVGDCALQVPTATSSTLTNTSTFGLGDGMIIDGNLLVKGGVTMYATSSESPITDFYTSSLVLTETANSSAFNDKGIMFGSDGKARISINSSNDVGIYAGGSLFLRPNSLSAASSVGMCLETTGNAYLSGGLTIGATPSNSNVVNNTYKLYVTGKAYVTGTLTQGSDIRYKNIHKDILLSLATMAEAPSIEFHFKDDEQKSTHIGTSAQYWQSVSGVVTEDSEGRLGMDYSSLGVVMGISLAKELSRFENDTDRRIRLLEEENKRLKEEIEQLKTA